MEITYFAIIIGAIFVNNVVLAQFLGICPFLGVSSKVETSMGMGAAVTFVMALTAVVAWPIQTYILVPLHIEYMQTIVFILVIDVFPFTSYEEYNDLYQSNNNHPNCPLICPSPC